ncbi:MAG: hypothetical protein N2Z20_05945, partial [Elusimicrobiales bacterium]|nr:hypothetical protein [Elusimicrobiales bacterium]
MAIKIAVFFGGKSVEHEVSIESAKNVISNLKNINDFEVYPVYCDLEGRWFYIYEFPDMSKSENIIYDFSNECFILEDIKIKFDICFSLIHGNIGEDGKLIGFFETISVAYTGCDTFSSAICMNK